MSTAAAVCIGRDAGMTGVSFEHMGKLGKGLPPKEAGFTATGGDARLRRQTSDIRHQTPDIRSQMADVSLSPDF